MGKISKDVVHATGSIVKSDKKTSCLRKLRVVFKGVDGVADMDTASGAYFFLFYQVLDLDLIWSPELG